MISKVSIAETPVLITSELENLRSEIQQTFQSYHRLFILMDNHTQQFCFPVFSELFSSDVELIEIVVSPGEVSKSLSVAEQCWKKLLDKTASKKDALVCLGGGVVSDLGGFVAALYKRGMHFYSFPTTLMAMTDAALGGKTGVDFEHIKNSIGVFNSPQKIFVATQFLESLSSREFKNGLAEIYKHAIIQDESLWNDLQSTIDIFEILKKSIAVKANVVNRDYHEKGERKILNFGHTIGHAIESYALANNINLLHGEAIIVGMQIESLLANQMEILNDDDAQEIISLLNKKFPDSLSFEVNYSMLETYILQDKKNTNQINFSLPICIGQCKYDCFASAEMINSAIVAYNKLHVATNN